MIMMRTKLNVADNTGAKTIQCISVIKRSSKRTAEIGDIITASVKEAAPNSAVKKGEKVQAVVVRTTKDINRKDGTILRFDTNAAVIIDAQKNPKGTRIFGPIARELRDKNFMKIISLAPEVL